MYKREQPTPLVSIIAELPGWEWILGTIDDIALAAPVPKPLLPIHRSRYFSPDTSIVSIVTRGSSTVFLFFQDHEGWINYGVYHLDSDKELIFPRPIVQAQKSSPIAACAFPKSCHDSSPTWIIDLFFINTSGIVADLTAEVTETRRWIFPPSISEEWSSGTLQELGLQIDPASKIAASRAQNNNSEILLVFEQGLRSTQSHIFEAIRKGDEPWEVLPRPNYQLSAFRGGPLFAYHVDSNTRRYAILHHSNTVGTLVASIGDPDLDEAYTTEEIMPSSHLPTGDITTGTYHRGGIRVCCTETAWTYGITYVAVRKDENTVDILFWQNRDGNIGRTIKTLPLVCKTLPETDFCLTEVKENRLLIFYVSVDAHLEVAVLKLDDSLCSPQWIPRRPIFMNCCKWWLDDWESD